MPRWTSYQNPVFFLCFLTRTTLPHVGHKEEARGKEECRAPIIHEFLKSSSFSSADTFIIANLAKVSFPPYVVSISSDAGTTRNYALRNLLAPTILPTHFAF